MHRCKWLYFEKQEERSATAFQKPRKAEKRKVAYCWQRGKTLRERECSACLLARLVSASSRVFTALDQKQPMAKDEWEERHGKGQM